MSTLNVASINSGPIGGMRNALINGNPTINQRGYVSGTATTGANQYTLDRWRVVVSGQALSWTDNENVRTVTAPAGGVEQVVEGINLLSGSYVLSWVGTATATINGAPVSNGSPVTLVGGVNTTVRFSGGTFALAQLEPGTRATPFERRSYGQELALCQRYCNVVGGDHINQVFALGINTSTTQGNHHYFHPVKMRSAPTLTVSAPGDLQISTGTAAYICTAVATAGAQSSVSSIVVGTVASGLTATQATRLEALSLNARMIWSAEL